MPETKANCGGSTLWKYVGKDDCVRRAPAIEPIASPPRHPMQSTRVR